MTEVEKNSFTISSTIRTLLYETLVIFTQQSCSLSPSRAKLIVVLLSGWLHINSPVLFHRNGLPPGRYSVVKRKGATNKNGTVQAGILLKKILQRLCPFIFSGDTNCKKEANWVLHRTAPSHNKSRLIY